MSPIQELFLLSLARIHLFSKNQTASYAGEAMKDDALIRDCSCSIDESNIVRCFTASCSICMHIAVLRSLLLRSAVGVEQHVRSSQNRETVNNGAADTSSICLRCLHLRDVCDDGQQYGSDATRRLLLKWHTAPSCSPLRETFR